jgi:hypothetical protein
MTPEQEARARMLRHILEHTEPQPEASESSYPLLWTAKQKTLEDAWLSVSALNTANDRLRWERDRARRLARQWQTVAYLVAAVGFLVTLLLTIVLVWGR